MDLIKNKNYVLWKSRPGIWSVLFHMYKKLSLKEFDRAVNNLNAYERHCSVEITTELTFQKQKSNIMQIMG